MRLPRRTFLAGLRAAAACTPAEAADIADATVARLELLRKKNLARNDDEFIALLNKLKTLAPRLAGLLEAEREFEPMEALLARFHLPVTPKTTAQEIRQVVQGILGRI